MAYKTDFISSLIIKSFLSSVYPQCNQHKLGFISIYYHSIAVTRLYHNLCTYFNLLLGYIYQFLIGWKRCLIELPESERLFQTY